MPRVPDRWFNYSRYGRPVADKFVALRVPLAKNYAVPDNQRFTPADALSKLPLGMIIDLTNTSRYYSPGEFTSRGVEYEKLLVKGHVVPEMKTVTRFIAIVNGFLGNASSKGKLIGVHCTHGLNRTGYLVCAYLILEMGYRASDAIEVFNRQRGHRMERANYLQSLHSLDNRRGNGDGNQALQHADTAATRPQQLQRPPQQYADRNSSDTRWTNGDGRLQQQHTDRNSFDTRSTNGDGWPPQQHADRNSFDAPWRNGDDGPPPRRAGWNSFGNDWKNGGGRHPQQHVDRNSHGTRWRNGDRRLPQQHTDSAATLPQWDRAPQGHDASIHPPQFDRTIRKNGVWKQNGQFHRHHQGERDPLVGHKRPNFRQGDALPKRSRTHIHFPDEDG